ncbi:MAG: peroxiredoxin [Sorangiineae bacterium]|nr:peroxiredoxin [Polyangiaceae bacterium]MEB2323965.1 peroxiredoxin [Sorangiineae bacterium]
MTKSPRSPAAPTTTPLAVGEPAPEFESFDQHGACVRSASLANRSYVLYFYPKDATPGCTREATDFEGALARFKKKGVRVLGVSGDTVASHARFAEKQGLTFTLLSDPERKLARAYGVWILKKSYGREYLGIERSTFLIDRAGRVAAAWRGVRVAGHVDEVLAALG